MCIYIICIYFYWILCCIYKLIVGQTATIANVDDPSLTPPSAILTPPDAILTPPDANKSPRKATSGSTSKRSTPTKGGSASNGSDESWPLYWVVFRATNHPLPWLPEDTTKMPLLIACSYKFLNICYPGWANFYRRCDDVLYYYFTTWLNKMLKT